MIETQEVERLRASNASKGLVLETVSKRRREWLTRLGSLSASHSAALDRSVKDPHPPAPLHHSVTSSIATDQSATDSQSRDDINLSHMRDWDATDTVPHEVWLTATRLEDEEDLSGDGDRKSSRRDDEDDDVMVSTPGSDSSFGRMLGAPSANGIAPMDIQEDEDQEPPLVSPLVSPQGLGNDFDFEF